MTTYEVLTPDCDISGYFGENHGWPTVIAIRDSMVVGAISTRDDDSAIICGPLKAINSFVVMRLIGKYENYLYSLGIKSYLFRIDRRNKGWVRSVESFRSVRKISDGRKRDRWYKKTIEGVYNV